MLLPYMLVFRDNEGLFEEFPEEKARQVLDDFNLWCEKLRSEERFLGAGKLTADAGKSVWKKDDEFKIDGPYCDSKEAIAGFYLILAKDEATACEEAKNYPMLDYGGSVEVRGIRGAWDANDELLAHNMA